MNDTSQISSTEDNISNYINYNTSKNTNNSFFNERKTYIDFSKLNLYSPRDCDDKMKNTNLNYLKKTKSYINKKKCFMMEKIMIVILIMKISKLIIIKKQIVINLLFMLEKILLKMEVI